MSVTPNVVRSTELGAPASPPPPPFTVTEEAPGIVPGARIPLGIGIACLILIALGLRPAIVSIGPILPDMINDFALSHTQASLLTAIPTLLMGLLALPTPWLSRRFGRDRAIIAALFLLAVATAGRAVSESTTVLFIATAAVGVGIAIAGALAPGFVKESFPSRVAMLMGIYAMALSLGSTFAASATGILTDLFGSWRVPAGAWAIPAILGVIAWLHVERRGKRSPRLNTKISSAKLPVRNRTAWFVAAFFALNNVMFYSYISWIAPVYVDLGHSASSAGVILACFTLAFMAANPLFGAISRNEDRRIYLGLGAAISLTGAIWIAVAPDVFPLVAISLAAFGTGGAFTLSMTLPLDNAKTDGEATSWNAFVMTVSYLVGATGPVLVGFLRDLTGSFDMPMWVLVAVSAAMFATTPLLQPYHHRQTVK